MILTRRAAFVALAAAVLAAVINSWWAVLIITAVLIAVIAADVSACPSPRALRVQRCGDRSVRLGERAETELMITNPLPRRVRATVRNAWVPSAGAIGGVDPLDVPARQRRRLPLTLLPTRRGDRDSGPVVIRVVGPLGLAGRQTQHDAPWTVRALPPFNARKHLPSRLARLRELDGRSSILQRGQGTEFDSLREYVPGDDVRSIDWRGTARSNTVVVRTWRPERDRHVLIVLDSGRTSAGRVGDQPKLDHGMDAALLLAALAGRAGDRVDLLIIDREIRAQVLRTSAAEVLAAFVDAMADVEPVLAETDHELLVTQSLQLVSQRSLVVIITGLDQASLAEGLIPTLGPLRRRHSIIVAAVSDPAVDELAAGREDVGAVYAAAAAEHDRTRRAGVAADLRRLGLSVVEAPPDRFAPDLADHYLSMKKAGRL